MNCTAKALMDLVERLDAGHIENLIAEAHSMLSQHYPDVEQLPQRWLDKAHELRGSRFESDAGRVSGLTQAATELTAALKRRQEALAKETAAASDELDKCYELQTTINNRSVYGTKLHLTRFGEGVLFIATNGACCSTGESPVDALQNLLTYLSGARPAGNSG